jgi:hypothetical protein
MAKNPVCQGSIQARARDGKQSPTAISDIGRQPAGRAACARPGPAGSRP